MSWKFEKEIITVEKIDIQSISEKFMLFGKFQEIRKRHGQKVQTECKICDTPFKNEEYIHLAINHGTSGNILLCSNCLEKAREQGVDISEISK